MENFNVTPEYKSFCRYVTYTRDFPPGFGSNVVGSNEDDDQENDVDDKNDFGWRRKVGAVKSKPGSRGESSMAMVKKGILVVEDARERAEVDEILQVFRQRCDELRTKREAKDGRSDLKAMIELENEGKISKRCASIVGPVSGVEVGKRFRYRIELVLVGLHKHHERGIDTMIYGDKTIATCIVATEGHLDNVSNPNALKYVGEGGTTRDKTERPSDQKLKGGNLGLWNSMSMKSPVRVVKGFKVNVRHPNRGCMVQRTEYVYDGLYEVQSYEKKKGSLGNLIFEFELLRCPGQPSVPWRSYTRI